MKVVFMGTPDFAVPTLQKLIDCGHEVIGVVTQPDKARGRGKAVTYSPVKEKAVEYNIPVYQPVKARDPQFIQTMKELAPQVIVVVAFGQILPKEILDIPEYGCINVHASLLPKYRGAAPIQWAVINGENVSGVTTMYMAEGLDTGDMLMKTEVALDPDETGGSLHDKLAAMGADLLIKTLDAIADGTLTATPQDDSQAGQYAKMLTKTMGEMDFSKPALELERLIRGLNPWPSAYTKLHGKTLKIWRAQVVDKEYEGKLGEIVEITKECFIIKTGKGALAVTQLQMEGKKRMDAQAFMRGYSLKTGEILPD
ncbi:methionyl-tRNA formyltransferase [Catenibacillus scindens]|uniref:methionyl-tRNA formyltransferase n=1 Tax=Catenibacillus scindens TaxID=673271 RepID=UPI00320B2214